MEFSFDAVCVRTTSACWSWAEADACGRRRQACSASAFGLGLSVCHHVVRVFARPVDDAAPAWDRAPAINRPADAREYAHEPHATSSPRTKAGTVRRSLRAVAPMINKLGLVAPAEAVDQRGRLLIAGYAVKRFSASLSPRDRRESGRAVPRGAHRARSALSASARGSKVAGRAARETLGLPVRNGEAPSDCSLGLLFTDPRRWLATRENGSSGRTRTFTRPVNSRVLCH